MVVPLRILLLERAIDHPGTFHLYKDKTKLDSAKHYYELVSALPAGSKTGRRQAMFRLPGTKKPGSFQGLPVYFQAMQWYYSPSFPAISSGMASLCTMTKMVFPLR